MKKFFEKIITERPRACGGVKSPKGQSKQDQLSENAPKREKIRLKWQKDHSCKEFTDVISPLNRWLASQVGRPWDKVYSEICENLPKTTKQYIHIHEHIGWFVETNVEIIDGVACHKSGVLHGHPIQSSTSLKDFYVHPKTGLLIEAPRIYKKKRYPPDAPKWKEIQGKKYFQIDGIWYEIETAPIPKTYERKYFYDPVLKQTFKDAIELCRIYGKSEIGVSKRQLNKKEIRQLGLAS